MGVVAGTTAALFLFVPFAFAAGFTASRPVASCRRQIVHVLFGIPFGFDVGLFRMRGFASFVGRRLGCGRFLQGIVPNENAARSAGADYAVSVGAEPHSRYYRGVAETDVGSDASRMNFG